MPKPSMPKPSSRPIALALLLALSLGACAKNVDQTAALGGAAGAGGFGGAGAATPGSAQDFTANVGDRVFFETDSIELTAAAQGILDRQAEWLGRYTRHAVTIEGHADERGTREYNFALGAQRAQAARDYLASRGVAASRVRTTSYGKERPVAACNEASCQSQNRRAVTLLGGGTPGV